MERRRLEYRDHPRSCFAQMGHPVAERTRSSEFPRIDPQNHGKSLFLAEAPLVVQSTPVPVDQVVRVAPDHDARRPGHPAAEESLAQLRDD
ncbi:MAG: hypothetical protein IBJ00_08045 [Alphaproteobacteria bacterium]|nr:hypothetical protein [Alphaproteobacteria bacterium]